MAVMNRASDTTGHPAGPAGVSAASGRRELDLFDVLALAWAERGFIALVFAVLFALGVAGAMLTLKTSYTAESRFLVLLNEDPTPAAAGWGDGFMLNQVMQSESELLSSEAVRRLALDTLGTEAVLGEAVDGDARAAALKTLRGGFGVSREPNSSALNASFEAGDPERAALILNAIVDAYLAYREQVLVETGVAGLGVRRAQANAAIATSRQALDDFLDANGLSNFEAEQQTAQNLLGNLTDRLNSARADRDAARAGAEALRQRLEQIPQRIELYVENGVSGRLLDLRAERASLLARYQPGAPAVTAVEREIAALESFVESGATAGEGQRRSGANPVRQELESELATREADARSRAALAGSLEQQLRAVRADVDRLRGLETDYTRLAQNVSAAEEAAAGIAALEASAEARRAPAIGSADAVRVIDRASPPLEGSSMKKLALMAAAVMAMGVALVLGLLRGYWRTYVAAGAMRRPQPAANDATGPAADPYGGLPVLARIADRTA
jgi:uncharacterized protein involved in exopolysaccharide biosynthesis